MEKTILLASILFTTTQTFAETKNVAEPDVKWSKTSLKVCWASYQDYLRTPGKFPNLEGNSEINFKQYTAEQKVMLKSALQQEINKPRTGLEYVGWEDCSPKKPADIYLFKINNPLLGYLGIATIGESADLADATLLDLVIPRLVKKKEKVIPSVAVNTATMHQQALNFNDTLVLTFLHEMGHSAGLRHEHIDPEASKTFSSSFGQDGDRNCQTVQEQLVEPMMISTKKFSVYDHNSIMNYCFLHLMLYAGKELTIPTALFPVPKIKLDLFDSTIITPSNYLGRPRYQIRIGLSQGDVHALRCLYQYDNKTAEAICKPTHNPKLLLSTLRRQ